MLKNIRETLIFGPECREHMIPLGGSAGESLRAVGVQMAGRSELSTEYRAGRVAPPYHVVLVTVDGGAVLRTNTATYHIPSGTITVLPQGLDYAYEPARGKWTVAWFHLAHRPRWRMLREVQISGTPDGATLERLGIIYTHELRAGREAVASLVARSLARALVEILAGVCASDNEPEERLRDVIRTVENDLQRAWTEGDLAAIAHYSPQHLRRLANQHWGAPPLKLVTRIRMERAMALLEHSSLRLGAIAAAVGYSDEFAFSTAFRRSIGMSPGTWRTHCRGNRRP